MYIRNPKCTCQLFRNIDDLPFTERSTLKNYWREGYMYTPQGSVECDCHKKYRLSKRYDVVASQLGLPLYNDLKSLQYIGEGNAFNKLKAVPDILNKHPSVKDVIIFCTGPIGNQKTTCAAKYMYNLISEGYTVEYVNFHELIQKFLSSDYRPIQYEVADWLIIDDCFEHGSVNFKTTFNAFYNLLLKRHAPTIIISNKSKDDILKDKMAAYYNESQLQNLFNRIERFQTTINFTDNVDKIQFLKNGPIDLWSMRE